MFLISVITEVFFGSEACCGELDSFLDRETKLGRDDLVLPLYYITSDTFEKPEKRAARDHARAIHAHQYRDWRALRFLDIDSPAVWQQIAKLAEEIKDALYRTPSIHIQFERTVSSPPTAPASLEGSSKADEDQKPEHEPPTQVDVPATAGETDTAGRPPERLPEIADPHKQLGLRPFWR